MPEHLIRLRGGWLRLDRQTALDHPATASAPRVTLPITWPDGAGSGGGVRLSRSFGPPPLDRDHERLALRLTDIEGLVSAHLNGREIARPAPGTTAIEVALPDPLPPRNLLELEVDVARASSRADSLPRPWGAIALVIAAREASPHPARGARSGENAQPRRNNNGDDVLGGTVPGA